MTKFLFFILVAFIVSTPACFSDPYKDARPFGHPYVKGASAKDRWKLISENLHRCIGLSRNEVIELFGDQPLDSSPYRLMYNIDIDEATSSLTYLELGFSKQKLESLKVGRAILSIVH